MERIALCFGAFALVALAVLAAPPANAADVTGVVSVAAGGQEPSRLVVFLDADPSLAPAPPDTQRPQIVQKGKAFVPDLLVVSQGTTVEFPNWDPFSHNVFSRSQAASFDLDRYGQGQSKSVTFNNVGLVQIFCNIHPQMKASLLVVPNHCYARADAKGQFTIHDVPPGRYVLIGWGLRAGEQRQTIVVPPEGLRDVAMALPGAVARETSAEPREPISRDPGVARGLGVKRERLNLPVVQETHPAPTPMMNR
jgi:plastocyanin